MLLPEPALGASIGPLTKADGNVFGSDFRWQTPVKGLLAGMSTTVANLNGASAAGGSFHIPYGTLPVYYVKYERGRFMAGGEYRRSNGEFDITITNITSRSHQRLTIRVGMSCRLIASRRSCRWEATTPNT